MSETVTVSPFVPGASPPIGGAALRRKLISIAPQSTIAAILPLFSVIGYFFLSQSQTHDSQTVCEFGRE